MKEPPAIPCPAWWLVRIPEVFRDLAGEIAGSAGVRLAEGDYYRLDADGLDPPLADEARMFCRWLLPVHHAWPCNPRTANGFVEKAARGVKERFAPHAPRAVLAGALDPATQGGYFRKLASNLRGRLLQLMPDAAAGADDLTGEDRVAYVMVGRGGLFCGLSTPRAANGFHPGGTRYIRQADEELPSRAGAKIAEALHHLRLFGTPPPAGTHWLELGASPGGMTRELLRHGYRVTAIDRAPLHSSLDGADGVAFSCCNVAAWKPPAGTCFGALLCDMNGPAMTAMTQVARLAKALDDGAPVIFTLKTAGAESFDEIASLQGHVSKIAVQAGLRHLQTTHLTYNRREFTMFLERG